VIKQDGPFRGLVDERGRAQRERIFAHRLLLQHAQDDDLRTRGPSADVRQRGDATHAGHHQVQQDQFGLELRGQTDGLLAIPGLRDDLELGAAIQPMMGELTRRGLIVDDHDAVRHEGRPRRGSIITESKFAPRIPREKPIISGEAGEPFPARARGGANLDTKRAAHRILPGLLTVFALVSLMGWLLHERLNVASVPTSALTKVNAAICILLLAGAFYLLQFSGNLARRSALVLSAWGLAIVMVTIFEYLVGVDIGIDQAFIADTSTDHYPGRMSPLSAIILVIIGCAIIGETIPQRVHAMLSPTLYSLSLFLALTALLGYLYGVPLLYGTGPTTRVALSTAIGLTLLSLAGLFSTSARSYVRLFIGPGPLARGARRMLLVAILMPALALWLRAPAERVGLIDPQSGAAFIALSSMPLLVVAVWWTVREINTYQNQILAMQMQLERRVEQRTLELERANKELEAFNYSVSHDLRNPLHIVRGGTDVILQDPDPKTVLEFGPDVKSAADRMNDIIESLLKLSRISRTEIERKPLDLSQIAHEVAEQLALAEPRRRYQFDIQPGLTVEGDGPLLRIVLENLLSNACKFSRGQAVARIAFGTETTERGTAYYVRDNGVGFDMKQADRLFQPFHRLHRRDEFEGTGVGLATVARIVQRHGGNVFAKGAPGQGATMYFTLAAPLRAPPPTSAVRIVAPSSAANPGSATPTT
jgi:signal transduction histidine kinase